MHDSFIAQDHLLLALLKDPTIAGVLKETSLTEPALKTAIQQARGDRRVDSKTAEQGFDALSKYAVDLTALAEEGKIDPVIGRDNEIRRVIRILCRRCVPHRCSEMSFLTIMLQDEEQPGFDRRARCR